MVASGAFAYSKGSNVGLFLIAIVMVRVVVYLVSGR